MNRRQAMRGMIAAGLVPTWLLKREWLRDYCRLPDIPWEQFCHKRGSWRYDLKQPFVQHRLQYATDARIMVRAAADKPAGDGDKRLPDAAKTFDTLIQNGFSAWQPYQPGAIKTSTSQYGSCCVTCDGEGVIGGERCECCDGKRRIEDYQGESVECPCCDGRGKSESGHWCRDCNSTGSFYHDNLVSLGQTQVARQYWELVATLPGPIEFRLPEGREQPVHFRFSAGAGEGFLMPMLERT